MICIRYQMQGQKNMKNKFILTTIQNVNTGFLIEDGKINEIRCYEDDSLIGNIYVGRVSNILPNINAAFIDIKKGLSCYYPLEEYRCDKKLRVGDIILCQVVKDAIKTKQPVVTTNISLTGKYAVVSSDGVIGVSGKIKDKNIRSILKDIASSTIASGSNYDDSNASIGIVIRTCAGEEISGCEYNYEDSYDDILTRVKNDITGEISGLIEKLNEIYKKSKYVTAYSCLYQNTCSYVRDAIYMLGLPDTSVITDDKDKYVEILDDIINNKQDIPDLKNKISFYEDELPLDSLYNLKRELDRALNKYVYLKSGATLVIEHTEAMTVIDVNSSKAVKKGDVEESIFKINCEAAKEIARQLRLRNISGIVVIDFINMKNSGYDILLLDKFKEFVQKDFIPVKVVDITRLGLVELTRKKVNKPIFQIFK